MRACARTATALGAAKTGALMMSLGRRAEAKAGLLGLDGGAGVARLATMLDAVEEAHPAKQVNMRGCCSLGAAFPAARAPKK